MDASWQRRGGSSLKQSFGCSDPNKSVQRHSFREARLLLWIVSRYLDQQSTSSQRHGEPGQSDRMLESTSFTPLGTISPQVPALLLGGACNPVMDLVALITSPKHLPAAAKGKARAGDDRKVSLWRMSGTKVWEVGYDGVIAGLAWSPDGEQDGRWFR